MSEAELAMGVDGGGSKTVAWLGRAALADTSGKRVPDVIGVGESGPSNQRAVGFDTATQNISRAIHIAFERAGLMPTCLPRACLCLAGAGRVEEREKITSWAVDQKIARVVDVVHDGEAMLAAAGFESGIALISGTGSLAWGRATNLETSTILDARCGGWGYLIDDSGSGYAIGSECLAAIARQTDRRGPETELTAAVLAHYRLKQPTQLIDRIYSASPSPREIAKLAPLVFALNDSDPVARTIIDRAAESLADSVESVYRQLRNGGKKSVRPLLCKAPEGPVPGKRGRTLFFRSALSDRQSERQTLEFDLALGGSVLRNQHAFRAAVIQRIQSSGVHLRHTNVIDQPVRGALNLAVSR